MFSLLIDNISMIIINENKKIIKNVRHIDICYYHIQNLIEKKIIEISHILTDEIIVNDLTKILLLNKFKKFIELIRVSKIETDSNNEASNSKISDNKISNNKFNNSEISSNIKNNENFVTNYY